MKDKNLVFAIIVAIMCAAVWIGVSVLVTTQHVDVDPNAESFARIIAPKFNTDVLDKIDSRVQSSTPVKPEVFEAYETAGNNQ